MEEICRCHVDFSDPQNISCFQGLSKVSEESKVIEKIVLDFGKVAVFGKYTKTVSIRNFNQEDVASYRIKRDASVGFYNPAFSFNRKEGFVKANAAFIKLKVDYLPTIPFYKDVGCFEFVDNGYNVVKIVAKGETKGPQLSTSTNVIHFFLHPPKKRTKKVFEIVNSSDVPAEFMFDFDEKQELFQVEPRKGVIRKHMYIAVFFAPKSGGVFSQQLTCFVWGHKPFSVDLIGILTKEKIEPKDVIFQPYPLPTNDILGNTECSKIDLSVLPPISLSRNFIDFGRVINLESNQWNGGVRSAYKRQAISVTNNMKHDIEVFWVEDDEIFCANPKRAQISPNHSFFFEFYFTPPDNNCIYSRSLTAQVYWVSEMKKIGTWNVPFTASIILQGNSFTSEAFVITNVEISPPQITFPVCLPEDVTIQNFKIRNVGPVPVMYKLVPPYSTNMAMKPTAGIIEDYVIIQAQLRTCEAGQRQFFETWYLELNSREEKKIPISFSGVCALPSVQIGDNNVVVLERIQAYTYGMATVSLRNTSCHHLRFVIDTGDSELVQLDPTEADLEPYDEILLTCNYTASVCFQKKTSGKIYFQILRKFQELVGLTYETEFTVYTDFTYAQLCATPTSYNFDIVQWGKVIQSQFHVFNFGDIAVFFKMRCINRSHNQDQFQIIPSSGEVKPGEKLEILVEGCAQSLGSNEITVVYSNRISEYTEAVDFHAEPIELYKFIYDCQFPRLQLEDVVEHDFGPLFNKKHMWEFLNLDRLNDALGQISEEDTETIHMALPDFEVGPELRYVTVLIENTTNFETKIELKRKKMCDCHLQEAKNTFNTTKQVYNCPHRETLSLELSDNIFFKQSSRLLTITVKYSIPGRTKMGYSLDLGDGRIIELIFLIYAIPENAGKISCYTDYFSPNLTNVAMSRKKAPIQTYWLYNNTKRSARYEIDTENVQELCRYEGFVIFQIVNPSGEIEPYTAWPLMIKFHPIEIKEYQVSVPIYFDAIKEELNIRGSGRHAKKASEFLLDKVTRSCTATYKVPATLSTDYLTVDPLLVWNSTERIIFIKNITKDRILQYHWGEAGIRNVVKITVVNKYGTLKPKESHSIVLKIFSFNEACITDISLSCTVDDLSGMYVHKKSMELHQQSAKEMEGQFIINETGTEEMHNNVILQEEPQPWTLSINIDINIIHAMDLDILKCSNNLFTCSPQADLDVDVNKIVERYSDSNNQNDPDSALSAENSESVRTVMRQLISEVVFGNTFQKLLETSTNQSPVYYDQVTLDAEISQSRVAEPLSKEAIKKIREDEIKKFFSRPKLPVLSGALKELILDGIQEVFQLGVTYPEEYDEKKVEKEVELLLPVCDDCACKIQNK
nr:cilia- and flagella-associated protein 65-like [Leptinotarsa decemlineata]